MEKIIFKAKAGKVTIGEDDRPVTLEDLSQLSGVSCQDDFAEYSDLSRKLESGYMSFKFEDGILYTITEFELKEALGYDEIEKLKSETQGQWSDGIGEGFEQSGCAYIADEEVFISPWFQGQEIETFIDGQSTSLLCIKGDIPANLLQFNGNQGQEILKFMPNGDVFVYGRLAINDMEIVEGIRAFLKDSGYIKPVVDIDPIEEKSE